MIRESTIQVPEHMVPGGWVIGGATRLLDVWSPSTLIMRAPAFRYPEHGLRFTLSDSGTDSVVTGKGVLGKLKAGRTAGRASLGDSDFLFDCRHDSTANVAHVLQGQIAVALTGLDAMGLSERWRDLVFVVDTSTPQYSIDLFKSLDFRVLATDSAVAGHRLSMQPRKFPLRAIAALRLRRHAVEIGLLSDSDATGERVFLARRGRRSLTNMQEVEPLVNKAGFRTVFAEDLPAEKQIQTIARAESIFGLHGAAMGFMMLRNARSSGFVIECFPCGYATNWARAICSITGDAWLGGQGELEASVIANVLNGCPPRMHEADNYKISIESIVELIRAGEQASQTPDHTRGNGLLDTLSVIDVDIPAEPVGIKDSACPKQ